MALNPRTWRAVDRRRAGYRRTFRKIFLRALDQQIKPLLRQVSEINVNNTIINDVIVDNTGVEKSYEQLYKTVGLEFAQFERQQALKSKPANMQIKENDFWESTFLSSIEAYISTGLVGSNIRAVGDTSKEHLQKLLNELMLEVQEMGLSSSAAQTMLRDRLTSRWHRDMRFRTERIVRTELTRASNWGSVEGIKSTGIPMYKFWVATISTQTRKAHDLANGQKRDLNEPFEVDGELLMFPGDISLGATAKNIVNCRCTVTYQPKVNQI